MRLALTVELPGGEPQDVAVQCDVTATVGELARAIACSAPFDAAELREFARRGLGHLTLLATHPVPPPEAPPVPVVLDPLAPLTASGLRSGATVRPVCEDQPTAHRSTPVTGHVDVQNGAQAGARYLLVPGPNPIGRAQASRVPLRDRSVSRRHAVIHTPDPRDRDARGTLTLTDLASANGIEAAGARVARLAFDVPTTVTLGTVSLRITPRALAAAPPGQPPASETSHTRSPRVHARFPRTTRVLPTPPSPPQAARLPVLALIAPALIGVAMFLVTRSPLSLLMVVFSPMMAVGSWLDGKLRRTRSLRSDGGAFASSLAAEREILSDLHAREQRVRDTRAPTGAQLAGAAALRDTALWSRRAAYDGFLALRLGTGSLPSRTGVTLPPRGDAAAAHWAALEETAAEFQEVPGVPIVADLGRCGSLGVAGTGAAAHGLARSLIAQLVTLHSPTDLRLAAIALGRHGSADARVTGGHAAEPAGYFPADPPTPGARALGPRQPPHPWGWLKWLPHVHPVAGEISVVEPVAVESATGERPMSGPAAAAPGGEGPSGGGAAAQQLAETEEAGAALAGSLEAVLSARAAAPPAPTGAAAGSHTARESVVLLVIDQGLSPPLRARLIGLAARGPAHGVHTIWVAPRLNRIPAACDVYVEFPAASAGAGSPPGAKPPTAGFVREGVERPLDSVDTIDEPVAAALARTLAPLTDAAAGAHSTADLPQRAQLRDLHDTDLLGGGAPIARQWRHRDSLVRHWRAGKARTPAALAATVGQGLHGPLRIDLSAHGPHALVGGTTGSGKSEFLQTWIMSLAANLSPDRLTFLLVDYKGGAAFAECVELPHTVGLVTDLTPHLVRRALASLRAELRRRELLLATHEAKDLAELERRSERAAPPFLVIVIDEFAALAHDAPEFVAGVVDIAQRGRSLGLHLIMATQRPAGVVSDNLRANTNVRIALRVADRADSRDVLGGDDAALFRVDTPGRAAVKIGSAPLAHFQTGYLGDAAAGGSAAESAAVAAAATEIEIRSLPFGEGSAWPPSAEMARPKRRAGAVPVPRDIERLRDGIRSAAAAEELPPPRRPWLPELPRVVSLRALEREELSLASSLAGPLEGAETAAATGCSITIGREDVPEAQAQPAAGIDLDACGNLAVIGASGAGKTTALVTIASSAASGRRDAGATDPIHLYGIDAAGAHLGAVAALPTCGGVAQLADLEVVLRTLRHVHDTVVARRSRLAAAAAPSDSAGSTPGGRVTAADPRLILLIDGLSALTQALTSGQHRGDPMRQLTEIMRGGRAVRVHVVLTCDRPAAIPAELAATVGAQLVLRLASPFDFAAAGVRGDTLDGAPPGRGVFSGRDTEVQVAIAGTDPDPAAQSAAVQRLGARLARLQAPRAAPIRKLAQKLPLHTLGVEIAGRPVIGVHSDTLAELGMPVAGLGVLSGPAGAGLTTASRTCAAAVARLGRSTGQRVERVLLRCAAQPGREPAEETWERVARGPQEAEALARELVVRLTGEDTAQPCPAAGSLAVVVVEAPAEAQGTALLAQLVRLAQTARRAGALVLFECEEGSIGGAWELLNALKQPTWGIALQPDAQAPPGPFRESFGRVQRADFRPGQGVVVERGVVTPVQIAVPITA